MLILKHTRWSSFLSGHGLDRSYDFIDSFVCNFMIFNDKELNMERVNLFKKNESLGNLILDKFLFRRVFGIKDSDKKFNIECFSYSSLVLLPNNNKYYMIPTFSNEVSDNYSNTSEQIEELRQVYLKCLDIAYEKKCLYVAFISLGNENAIRILVRAMADYELNHRIRCVVICNNTERFLLHKKVLEEYEDELKHKDGK